MKRSSFMVRNAQTNHKETIPLLFNKTLDQMRSVGACGGRARARNLRMRRRGSHPLLGPPIEIERNTESTAEATAILDAKFPWLVNAEQRGTRNRA